MRPLKGKLILSFLAFAVLSLGSAMSAKADVVVVGGNVPQLDENVQFNDGQMGAVGNPIFGTTNNTMLLVRFSGNEMLTSPSGGQARVEAVDGSLNALTIDVPGGSFTSLILNLNAESTGTVFFTATDTMGDTFLSSFALGNGSNFFTFTTMNNQRIASVSFTTTVAVGMQLDDVRQVRIGGAQLDRTPVPEPATMILLGTGLAGIAAKVRKRRKGEPEETV
jgi:hypothetical protein